MPAPTDHQDERRALEAPGAGAPGAGQGRPTADPRSGAVEVVVIGCSTGGPPALVELLSSLPAGLAAGVVVAQHMPPGFTQTLATRLDRRCALRVEEARDGDLVAPGVVLVAPGGMDTAVTRQGGRLVARVTPGAGGMLHHPSVDHLFGSAAWECGARTVGIILTGMGHDGAEGLRLVRRAGGRTIVESAETAVVYGMPRTAAPAAEQVLRLEQIGPALVALCATRPRTGAQEPAGGA